MYAARGTILGHNSHFLFILVPRLCEERPCEFKILLLLPEGWHYQSNFKMY